MTRHQRIHERLRLAARLYQMGQHEASNDCTRTALGLCSGARLMAGEERDRDLARWAMACEGVCFEAMGVGS